MDKLFDDSDFSMIRLACNCLSPYHSLDVTIERDEKTGELIDCCIHFNVFGKPPLRWRLKQIWKLLFGRDAEIEEFYPRTEDIPKLIEFLEKAVDK